jgi:hypothetical protein
LNRKTHKHIVRTFPADISEDDCSIWPMEKSTSKLHSCLGQTHSLPFQAEQLNILFEPVYSDRMDFP